MKEKESEPMSQWKWNDVELEIDMDDVEFLERYEKYLKTSSRGRRSLKRLEKYPK